jgi:cytochrome c oxidase subunit II
VSATGRRDDEGSPVIASGAPRPRRPSRRRTATIALVAPAVVALAGCGSNMGLPDSATSQGEEVISLWQIFLTLAILVAALIWVLVGFTVIASLRRRRERAAAEPTDLEGGDVDNGNGGERGGAPIPEQVQYRTKLEIFYTAVPLLLVFVLLGFTFRVDRILTETTEQPELVVEVTGFQWQWQFHYPDLGITIAGDPEDPPVLYLPVGRTIRFKLLAEDVIHSFWVPEFLEKRDMVPGVTNEIEVTVDETGYWVGRCAEYCGLNHWQMWFDVNAVAGQQFDTWAQVTATQPQPVIQGRAQVTSTTSSTAVPVTTPPPTVSIPPSRPSSTTTTAAP